MNPKGKQKEIITKTLKPILKKWGYKTAGQNWWKINGDFFNAINLQNFSWNTQNGVDFCFNFSTGLSKTIQKKSRVTTHDGITYQREVSFLPNTKTLHRDDLGYHITPQTDINAFGKEIGTDFESIILPKLDSLKSIDALLGFYKDGFFADRLRLALKDEGYIK
jgi:hypothetical protein